MKYSYEITPRPVELGGGWRLRLLEGSEEMGGGVFPIDQEQAAPHKGMDWWNSLQETERAWWLERTVERGAVGTAAEAYLSYLLAEAHADAEATAYEWLDSRDDGARV
ncbi:hypothetical protein ACFFKC_22270 [Pseudoduganella danionis]|uniref:Uncharacterized protein n=1 Tax=Pseudoduganella danionis TaxID=1890295 RepID=A0ABW9SVC7_9BURK|nr:hypothetical protein [Pseudoduganella danionis]MTW35509.1 hypothetical protein [Pseudoduganella danionis]